MEQVWVISLEHDISYGQTILYPNENFAQTLPPYSHHDPNKNKAEIGPVLVADCGLCHPGRPGQGQLFIPTNPERPNKSPVGLVEFTMPSVGTETGDI